MPKKDDMIRQGEDLANDIIAGAKQEVEKRKKDFQKFKKDHDAEITYLKKTLNQTTILAQKAINTSMVLTQKAAKASSSITKPIGGAVSELKQDFNIHTHNWLGARLMNVNPFLGYAVAKLSERYSDDIKRGLKQAFSKLKDKAFSGKQQEEQEKEFDKLTDEIIKEEKAAKTQQVKKKPVSSIPVKYDRTMTRGKIINMKEILVRIQSISPDAFDNLKFTVKRKVGIPIIITEAAEEYKKSVVQPQIKKVQTLENRIIQYNKQVEPSTSKKLPTFKSVLSETSEAERISRRKSTEKELPAFTDVLKYESQQVSTLKSNLIQKRIQDVKLMDIHETAFAKLSKLCNANKANEYVSVAKEIQDKNVKGMVKATDTRKKDLIEITLLSHMATHLRRIRVLLAGEEGYYSKLMGRYKDVIETFMENHRTLMNTLFGLFRIFKIAFISPIKLIFGGMKSKYEKDLGKLPKSPLDALVHVSVKQYVRLAQISDHLNNLHKAITGVKSNVHGIEERSIFGQLVGHTGTVLTQLGSLVHSGLRAAGSKLEKSDKVYAKTGGKVLKGLSTIGDTVLEAGNVEMEKKHIFTVAPMISTIIDHFRGKKKAAELDKMRIERESKPIFKALESYFGMQLEYIVKAIHEPDKLSKTSIVKKKDPLLMTTTSKLSPYKKFQNAIMDIQENIMNYGKKASGYLKDKIMKYRSKKTDNKPATIVKFPKQEEYVEEHPMEMAAGQDFQSFSKKVKKPKVISMTAINRELKQQPTDISSATNIISIKNNMKDIEGVKLGVNIALVKVMKLFASKWEESEKDTSKWRKGLSKAWSVLTFMGSQMFGMAKSMVGGVTKFASTLTTGIGGAMVARGGMSGIISTLFSKFGAAGKWVFRIIGKVLPALVTNPIALITAITTAFALYKVWKLGKTVIDMSHTKTAAVNESMKAKQTGKIILSKVLSAAAFSKYGQEILKLNPEQPLSVTRQLIQQRKLMWNAQTRKYILPEENTKLIEQANRMKKSKSVYEMPNAKTLIKDAYVYYKDILHKYEKGDISNTLTNAEELKSKITSLRSKLQERISKATEGDPRRKLTESLVGILDEIREHLENIKDETVKTGQHIATTVSNQINNITSQVVHKTQQPVYNPVDETIINLGRGI